MKTLLLPLLAVSTLCATGHAAQILVDTGSARGHQFVATDNATRLAVGSLIRYGTLTVQGDVASFVEFATTTINNTGGASTVFGFHRNTVDVVTPAVADSIKGKQIAMWVYNSPLAATATEHGLFTSSEWTLPVGFTSAGDVTFLLRVGGNSAAVPATPGVAVTALLGTSTIGPITLASVANNNGNTYRLAAIPEPSVTMLMAGLLVPFMRRRR